MVFWITYHMKAKREQKKEEQIVIKLFSLNYARDLVTLYSSPLALLLDCAITVPFVLLVIKKIVVAVINIPMSIALRLLFTVVSYSKSIIQIIWIYYSIYKRTFA